MSLERPPLAGGWFEVAAGSCDWPIAGNRPEICSYNWLTERGGGSLWDVLERSDHVMLLSKEGR